MDLENCHCPRLHCQNLYYQYCKSFFKTLIIKWLNFVNGVQLSQGYRASRRRQFTFYYKFPEICGTHLINLGMTKG